MRPIPVLTLLLCTAWAGCVGPAEGEKTAVTFGALTVGTTLHVDEATYRVGGMSVRTDAYGIDRPLIQITGPDGDTYVDPPSRSIVRRDLASTMETVGPYPCGDEAMPWLLLLFDRTFTTDKSWPQHFQGLAFNARAQLRGPVLWLNLSQDGLQATTSFIFEGEPSLATLRSIVIFERALAGDGCAWDQTTSAVHIIVEDERPRYALGDGTLQLDFAIGPQYWPLEPLDASFAISLEDVRERLDEEPEYTEFLEGGPAWPTFLSYMGPHGRWMVRLERGDGRSLSADVRVVAPHLSEVPLLLADVTVTDRAPQPVTATAEFQQFFRATSALREPGSLPVRQFEWWPWPAWGPGALIAYGAGSEATWCYLRSAQGFADHCGDGPPPNY